MRAISLEEHFVTQSVLDAVGGLPPGLERVKEQLLEVGEGRIASMDEGGVDVQVLSLMANGFDRLNAETQSVLARQVNDEIAEAAQKHPDRFAAFATLGVKKPDEAANELKRCVTKLGFVGAFLDGTAEGSFLDQHKFRPIFEAAQELDVPVYIHPAVPPAAVRQAYFSGLPGDTGFLLSIAGWGWHAEVGLHVLRLIVSGLFDELPNLKVIIGHMGEGLPYALVRSSKVLEPAMSNYSGTVAEVFKNNFYVTTSGYFTVPPLRCAVDVLGADRLMYSIDYPFSPATAGKQYLAEIEKSGVFQNGQMEAFTHGTAESLLKLKQPVG